jgi:hypothetical protein
MSMVGIGDKCRRPRLLLAERGLGANVRYWPKAVLSDGCFFGQRGDDKKAAEHYQTTVGRNSCASSISARNRAGTKRWPE